MGTLKVWDPAAAAWYSIGRGYPSGTSFPGSPTTDQIFYRTDRDMLFRYDGTRWLSFPEERTAFFINTSTATVSIWGQGYDAAGLDVYLRRCDNSMAQNGGTINGSNHWKIDFYKNDISSGAGGTDLVASSGNTGSDGSNSLTDHSFNLNDVQDVSLHPSWLLVGTKTGAPGALRAYGTVHWSYIG